MNARLNIRELDRIRVDIGTALQTEDELAETAPQRSQAHRVDGCSHPPERPGGTPRRYLADGSGRWIIPSPSAVAALRPGDRASHDSLN
jgi:hypothetical protein